MMITSPSHTLHPRTWLLWGISLLIIMMPLRHPLYLTLISLMLLSSHALATRAPLLPRRAFFTLASRILLFSTLFNFAIVHLGGTILWQWPRHWWIVGGNWTAESAVMGAINGLLLLTLFLTFITLNQFISPQQLLSLTPPALRDLGLVVLIALTYLPATLQQWEQIRTAQAIRGHQQRGWRDWRGLIMPLFVGGLERAMQLAETLTARGVQPTRTLSERTRLLLVVLLAAILVGILMGMWGVQLGWGGAAGAVVLLWAVIRQQQRGMVITHYRPIPYRWQDGVIALVAILTPILFVGQETSYTPYPRLAWPIIRPIPLLLLSLYALPLLFFYKRIFFPPKN